MICDHLELDRYAFLGLAMGVPVPRRVTCGQWGKTPAHEEGVPRRSATLRMPMPAHQHLRQLPLTHCQQALPGSMQQLPISHLLNFYLLVVTLKRLLQVLAAISCLIISVPGCNR